ncbi:hypothetical protein KL905_000161 [Ogataea polymorpha]|nr:hypothetical protein KL908_001274 [Ogataea polymorpha]KAG7902593.1 hypothetical protein KL935_001501 [Ogataea polymorpha]KAG7911419.1 hypothetical protein KL906_000740 [Ogataea polymorpha]KAG7912748.1 hypothetical protein KL907_000950 [Ogataea polymorpha]KAG7919362.1 hypothetical protein KL927_001491 [Ogataea polymorpha]
MKKLNYLPALGDLNTPLPEEQLAVLEREVEEQRPEPTAQSLFNLGWALIKSNSKQDNREGVNILTELFKNVPARRRECLYYLAAGCYKIGELKESKRYIDALILHEPDNLQAVNLKKEIESEISKDGLIGFAVLGGLTALGVGIASALIKTQSRKK